MEPDTAEPSGEWEDLPLSGWRIAEVRFSQSLDLCVTNDAHPPEEAFIGCPGPMRVRDPSGAIVTELEGQNWGTHSDFAPVASIEGQHLAEVAVTLDGFMRLRTTNGWQIDAWPGSWENWSISFPKRRFMIEDAGGGSVHILSLKGLRNGPRLRSLKQLRRRLRDVHPV